MKQVHNSLISEIDFTYFTLSNLKKDMKSLTYFSTYNQKSSHATEIYVSDIYLQQNKKLEEEKKGNFYTTSVLQVFILCSY